MFYVLYRFLAVSKDDYRFNTLFAQLTHKPAFAASQKYLPDDCAVYPHQLVVITYSSPGFAVHLTFAFFLLWHASVLFLIVTLLDASSPHQYAHIFKRTNCWLEEDYHHRTTFLVFLPSAFAVLTLQFLLQSKLLFLFENLLGVQLLVIFFLPFSQPRK